MVKPLGPRVLVEVEGEPSSFHNSILVKPDTVHETSVGWGKVMNLGHGTSTDKGLIPISGIKVGDRVAFVKFLKEGRSNKLVAERIGEDLPILDLKDILLIDGPSVGEKDEAR